jgi:hypothetical protein
MSQYIRELKRVTLDGDVIVLRVFENDAFTDKVYTRDLRTKPGTNLWKELPDYGTFCALFGPIPSDLTEE